jgi:hypothetical protein
MTYQFIPADWLELAYWNRPMVVYSRTVEIPDHSRPILVEGKRELTIVEKMLADLIEQQGDLHHD